MLSPKMPDKMGTGIVLGFCIPVAWVLLAAHTANSIDHTELSSTGEARSALRELGGVSAQPSGQGQSNLKSEEAKILARLGWKASEKKSVAERQAHEILDENIDSETGRAALRVRPGDQEQRGRADMSPNGDSEVSEEMSEENEALLAALVAEYEELEKSAEALLHTELESVSAPNASPAQAVPPIEDVVDQAVEKELQQQGLKVVGEGKQWIERGPSTQKDPDRISYSPHFGRLELLKAG